MIWHSVERYPRIFCFCAGLALATAFAPLHITPTLIVSLAVFAIALWKQSKRFEKTAKEVFWSAFQLGWFLGFGFFLAGLWWIGSAFLIEAEEFAWAMPFAVLGLPAGLALFWALAAACAVLVSRTITEYVSALTIAFTLAEILRGQILSGFPWNAVGYGIMPTPLLMQSASIVGLWGMTLFAFGSAFCIGMAFLARPPIRIILLSVVCIILASHVAFGFIRLSDVTLFSHKLETQTYDQEDPVTLRLVQPNISQYEKWLPENQKDIFYLYIALSTQKPLDDVDAIIWPESAFPFLIENSDESLQAIADMLPENALLISGAVLTALALDTRDTELAPPTSHFYNSMILFDHEANTLGVYHKRKLVPFGEYLPAEQFLSRIGISNLVNLPGGFTPGADNQMRLSMSAQSDRLDLPEFLALICYEAIFPALTRHSSVWNNPNVQASHGPNWILNLTNDAWFGRLSGPYQHFHQSRLRAVEQGLPMIRVANTGITAMVDPYGRIRDSINLNSRGFVDVKLTTRLSPTVYSIYGDLVPFLLTFALLIIYGWCRSRKNWDNF